MRYLGFRPGNIRPDGGLLFAGPGVGTLSLLIRNRVVYAAVFIRVTEPNAFDALPLRFLCGLKPEP